MGFAIADGVTPTQLMGVEATSKAGRVLLYGADGNPIVTANRGAISATVGGSMNAGQDYKIQRNLRAGPAGTLRTTTETLLFWDKIEGSTVNTSLWTPSTATMTITQANGNITYNAGASTANATDAIQTSIPQFGRLPRNPLIYRTRRRCLSVANTFLEFGFGAPVALTAPWANGAFFRYAGTQLQAVCSANSIETVTNISSPASANYAIYEIFLEDDRALFQVWTSDGILVSSTVVELPLTQTTQFFVSHVPIANRVYNNSGGVAGSAPQMLVASEVVLTEDLADNWGWREQLSHAGGSGLIVPTTYAQSTQLASGAAPAAFTPSNTVGGNAFTGGEALCNATATSENLLSVFAYAVPSPYTFLLESVYVGVPLNTVAAVATTATVLEFAIIANCAAGNINTGGGQRFVVPNSFFTAAVALAANALFSGAATQFVLPTPIPCRPGTTLHLAYKVILGTATATEVYRLNAMMFGTHM